MLGTSGTGLDHEAARGPLQRRARELDYEVAVVGGGPVGLALAALLGQRGISVGLFERFAGVYPLPRAIRFDGEVMRIFQGLGIVEEITPELTPMHGYRWFGADGEEIIYIDQSAPAPSGWGSSYTFWQPAVDGALQRRAASLPTVEVHRGWAAESFRHGPEHVELVVRQGSEEVPGAFLPGEVTRTVRAAYLVGADGANSVVRKAAGIEEVDLGFSEHWLVVDARPDDISRWDSEVAEQHCDPRRPIVQVHNGSSHRRWEFMILPGERPQDFEAEDKVWELLEGRLDRSEGELVRHTVYEFRSKVAASMNSGRVALVGDAAHVMPPFMGEGLCSGLRDANNLAWRLELALKGRDGERLLDVYTEERRPHNEAMIEVSLRMGKVSCTIDPVAAAARDAAFRSGEAPPPPPIPGLESGTLAAGDDPVAGRLTPQGSVRTAAGEEGRFDDVLGGGFALVLASGDPERVLDEGLRRFLASIDAVVVTLDPAVEGAVGDLDGVLSAYLRDLDRVAFLARPDGYGFGSAASLDEVPALVSALQEQLGAPARTPSAG